ncbi:Uncharacterised protein [Mycobacteroides abscessus subsp. abscessus]|nr:Uncharacterised protein [Mycobacteroides abscessus subsp. abscessus]
MMRPTVLLPVRVGPYRKGAFVGGVEASMICDTVSSSASSWTSPMRSIAHATQRSAGAPGSQSTGICRVPKNAGVCGCSSKVRRSSSPLRKFAYG